MIYITGNVSDVKGVYLSFDACIAGFKYRMDKIDDIYIIPDWRWNPVDGYQNRHEYRNDVDMFFSDIKNRTTIFPFASRFIANDDLFRITRDSIKDFKLQYYGVLWYLNYVRFAWERPHLLRYWKKIRKEYTDFDVGMLLLSFMGVDGKLSNFSPSCGHTAFSHLETTRFGAVFDIIKECGYYNNQLLTNKQIRVEHYPEFSGMRGNLEFSNVYNTIKEKIGR